MFYTYFSQSQCPQGTMPYIVQSGDTFYKLAARFNTTVEAIIAANPGVNPNMLMVGQQICIPGTTPPPTTCPSGTTAYTVRAGDTFFSIARAHNVSVDALIAANPGVNPDRLQIGQIICIPGTTPPPTTCPSGTTPYTVRAGDTFFSIARAHNVSVDALIAANPGVNPDRLQIGQIICIPGTTPPPTTCPSGTTPYTVRAGDTFFSIARAHNVSLDALMAANPGINPDRLQIGQIICIPGTTPPPTTCPSGTTPYTVRAGDTFYTIARAHNTTVDALMAANPGVNPERLQIGQIICIPGTTPPPTQTCPTLRVGSRGPDVRRLQQLLKDAGFDPGAIDGVFGSKTQAAVIAFQKSKNLVPDGIVGIKTWTALGVNCGSPKPPTCPSGSTAYTIKSGDTLYNLARRFGTTVEAITNANPGINPNNLQVGQVICIPGRG